MRKRILWVFLALMLASGAHAAKAKLTTHKEMMKRLQAVTGERVKVSVIGTSVLGKAIPLVEVSTGSPEKRLFIICRQHGDEPAPTEAMLDLIENLSKADAEEVLSHVAIYIVPMTNPDGADKYKRRNAHNVDLNRDWLKLSQPETRAVRAAIDAVRPDVILDEHELSPGNNGRDFIETAGESSGAPTDVAQESVYLQWLVAGMLGTHDIGVKLYRIDDHNPARLAHRYFPVVGGVKTLLFESRQAGRQYYLKYRMSLHTVGTMTVAKYLAGMEGELLSRLAGLRDVRVPGGVEPPGRVGP
ncbi:MAG: M14 family zinc carboxypeptidase [Armatimonadota bacterium]